MFVIAKNPRFQRKMFFHLLILLLNEGERSRFSRKNFKGKINQIVVICVARKDTLQKIVSKRK
jgi:hypothetical protein